MPGVKGKSGRKRDHARLIKDAIGQLSGRLPELIEKISDIAEGIPLKCPKCDAQVIRTPDKEALIYLIDRILGKPQLRSEIDIQGTVEITNKDIDRLREIAEQAQLDYNQGLLPGPKEED